MNRTDHTHDERPTAAVATEWGRSEAARLAALHHAADGVDLTPRDRLLLAWLAEVSDDEDVHEVIGLFGRLRAACRVCRVRVSSP
jgi:hypothetical protein